MGYLASEIENYFGNNYRDAEIRYVFEKALEQEEAYVM